MRFFLRGAEIWLGNEYLGDVSGEWLAAAVEKEIAELALSKRFQVEMEPHRLGAKPIVSPEPPQAFRVAKRQARRLRSKRKQPGP